jgi:hypothetical protein
MLVVIALGMAWTHASALADGPPPDVTGELDRAGVLWAPFLEWSLPNPSWEGNPFDLEASATFTHQASGERRTTPMFYDGGNAWKFRFTATRTGTWSVRTSSADVNLDNRQGTITVQANRDPQAMGFIIAHENKYARQVGEAGQLKAFVPNVYMNYRRFGNLDDCGWTPVTPTFSDPGVLNAYLDEAETHGCNAIQALIGNQWFKADVASSRDHASENPDPETFRALEQAIVEAHARGMHLHIWAWGDEQRGWTPIRVGGVNGIPDRRVQRYIAARLAPLPGWTLSYGFDLNEWVRPEQVASWAEYLNQHSGWQILLSARETRDGRSFRSPEVLPVASNDDGPAYGNFEGQLGLFERARIRLNQSPAHPAIFEQRFSYRRHDFWDMDTTRRAFWQFTLAGGIGSIWGHYPPDCAAYVAGEYPNPEQLRTHRRFWQERFLPDMHPANEKSPDDTTLVLQSGDRHAVLYREDAESIHLDLSVMAGRQPAIALDTKKGYAELDLGLLEPTEQTWRAPYRSDWAIAVGVFSGGAGPEN